MMIKIPLYVDILKGRGKLKRVFLNLNVYRNLHYRINNEAKKAVKAIVWSQLEGRVALPTPIELKVILYAPDKRERDLSNFCSIADKYVCDAVVEFGLLKDDNVKFIKRTVYEYGGVNKEKAGFEIYFNQMT